MGIPFSIILRKLRTFRALPPSLRGLTAEAWLLPMLIGPGFRLLGVPRTQAWLRYWTRAGASAEPWDFLHAVRDAPYAQHLVKRSLGVGGSCLVRSFTLWAMLLRRGVPTDIRVGLRRRDGQIEGHAWIEYGGVPLNEDESVLQTYEIYERPITFDVASWR